MAKILQKNLNEVKLRFNRVRINRSRPALIISHCLILRINEKYLSVTSGLIHCSAAKLKFYTNLFDW